MTIVILIVRRGRWKQSGRVNFPHSHRKSLNKHNWNQECSFQAPLGFPMWQKPVKNKEFLRWNLKESNQRGVVGQRLSLGEAFHTYFCELIIFEGYTDGRLSEGLPSRWISITILRDGREQGHTVNHPEALWFIQEQKSCKEKKLTANELRRKKPWDDRAVPYFGFAAADTTFQCVNVYGKLL